MMTPSHRYCRDCGYDLYGLEASHCPECGRGFDPDEPATFAASQLNHIGAPGILCRRRSEHAVNPPV